MKADDLRGLYAIIPTPARKGAERLDATDTIDFDETARLVDAVIRDGASGLIALGTTGECPTVSRKDYEEFVACVLGTVAGRVPAFIGTSALGGHEVAERMKFIREQGAEGTLLGTPQWQPVTASMAVEFYRQVSEYFPDVAVMVYANPRAFRFTFPHAFWEAVSKVAPSVIAAKMSRPQDLTALLASTGNRIAIVPNEMTVLKVHAEAPDAITACWATAAGMGPRPIVLLMEALLKGDLDEARRLGERIAWANEPVTPLIQDRELFALTNIQVEKIRINAAGYCNAGPIRPPYDELAPEHRAAAEACGQRWAQLCKALADQGAPEPAGMVGS